jgi:hypothetical protein
MPWKSKGLQLFTHMIKLVQSTIVPLKFRTKDCKMHWKVSKDKHAWKSLKVVAELKWTKRITCSTVLNLETGRWPAQRRNCTRMPLGSSKMDQNKFRRVRCATNSQSCTCSACSATARFGWIEQRKAHVDADVALPAHRAMSRLFSTI